MQHSSEHSKLFLAPAAAVHRLLFTDGCASFPHLQHGLQFEVLQSTTPVFLLTKLFHLGLACAVAVRNLGIHRFSCVMMLLSVAPGLWRRLASASHLMLGPVLHEVRRRKLAANWLQPCFHERLF